MPDFSYFPYEFRKNQKELMAFIQKSPHRHICIQAASGFGKTTSILSTLLPTAIKNNKKIIWIVKTGNETDRPIEELKEINDKTKNSIFGFSYRGKKDMCLLLKDFRYETGFDYSDVSFLCRHNYKDCKYLRNFKAIDKSNLSYFLSRPLLFSEILEFCENKNICPYMLQKEMLKHAKVVSMNYNYIISDTIGEGISSKIDFSNSILVVDEAHNIQQAASNINSSKIYFHALERVVKEMDAFKKEPEYHEIKKLVKNTFEFLSGKKDNMNSEEDIVNMHEFIKYISSGINDIESLLKTMKDFGDIIKERQMKEGKAPRSSLYHLADFILSVLQDSDEDGVILIATKNNKNLTLEKFDMRCAQIMRDKWNMFDSCIFCSGTLEPIEGFCEVVGIDNYSKKTIPSPYTEENAQTLITRGLTTAWKFFDSRMAAKYVSAIKSFLSQDKNLAVFSASYRIQNELMQNGLKEAIEEHNKKLFLETQNSGGETAKKILEGFKRSANGVLVATATGRFAEGADFPGSELEGIFLVGIPFDKISVKTKAFIDYYKKIYGNEKGQHYAYIVPAFRRVSQTLGRALRSKNDKAVFVLGDERYAHKRFFRLLPDYIRKNARLVEFIN